jgi:YQGE family putative transporter
MLVMSLVGKEGSLGVLISVGGVLSAILLYILGRTTMPRHRVHLLAAGLLLFLLGALLNAALFSALGVLLFMLLLVLARPVTDIAGFTIYLLAIDTAAAIEKRNPYSYVMAREFACYLGRASGMLLFILLASYVSSQFALRYALLVIGVLQLLSVPVAYSVLKRCYAVEATSEEEPVVCETRPIAEEV